MAAASLVSEIENDFLTCKLCEKPFNEPKALQCLHTFCRGCLATHIHRNLVQTNEGTGCVFCPTCQQISDVPHSGVDGLQDNHLLRNLLDMIYAKALQPCELCRVEGQHRSATYCCIKCEEFLCAECARMHRRTSVTKDHLVVNVGMMKDLCKGSSPGGRSVRLLTKFGRCDVDIHNPTGLCVNRADDIIISNGDSTISIFSQAGKCKKVIDQREFYGLDANYIRNKCVAVTAEGYVAVAMRKDITLLSAHVATIESLAGRETGGCTIRTRSSIKCVPHGIAVTNDNHIIVTDIGKHCIYVFDQEFKLVRQFGKYGRRGKQFKEPYFVTVNDANDIFISDYGNHAIKVFDFKGRSKLKFGTMGREPGQLMHPMGVCADRHGNIFVADRDNHRVQMFDSQGKYVMTVIEKTCKEGNDVRPQDVAITTNGHLVVLLKGIEGVNYAKIHIYQYSGVRVDQDEAEHDLTELRQSLNSLRVSKAKMQSFQRAGKLPPLDARSMPPSSSGQVPSAPSFGKPPDIVTEHQSLEDITEGGQHNDKDSTVCILL